MCPPRDSKTDRNPAACARANGSRSAGCDSIVTVRCSVNLKNCENVIEIQNPKNETDSNTQRSENQNKPSEAPPGFGLRQSSGAFGWRYNHPTAAEDCRHPK